mgnify:FL=1|tara:strand:- start:87 stop:626 length:540 start_codon:yes stop_codon:yes gene_type:complete
MSIHFADGTTQTSAAGGKILQVKTDQETTHTACTPDSQLVFKDIPLSVSITPSSSSNKILVSFVLFGDCTGNDYSHYFRVKRAISGGSTTFITAADQGNRTGTLFIGGMGNDSTGGSTPTQITMSDYLDSPSTTSAITYTVQHTSHGSQTFDLNRSTDTNNQDAHEDGISWLTVKEVAA